MSSEGTMPHELPRNVTTNEGPSTIDGASFSHPETNNKNSPRSTLRRVTVDAVHPFFTSYRNVQTYHCRACNEDFETSPKSLRHHFMSKEHSPISSCVYCHLPVYEYFYNDDSQIYHACDEESCRTRTGEGGDTIDDSTSDNQLNLSTSTMEESSSNLSLYSNTISSSVSEESADNASV